MQLIITEKPSVARDIARVLGISSRGDGYIEGKGKRISWCVGHVAQLAEPAAYNSEWKSWRTSTLPMIPEVFKLEANPRTRDQLGVLRKLLRDKKVTEVVNACDAGREGELIFRYVYDLTGANKPVKRLWLASMTDTAIRNAFSRLKPSTDYDDLGDAARSRSEADWLVGLNATRAMTLRYRQAGGDELMSVGRVQTPTLAMIVGRELEIEAFEPDDFWQVYATFDAGEQPEGVDRTYEGAWTRKKSDRTYKKEEAEQVLADIDGETGEVVKVQQKDVRRYPPQLFDLTSLQREANRRFGFSAQATLDAAQNLYEKAKLITYPRTDSNYLTKDMKSGLPDMIRAINVAPYSDFCDTLLNDLPLKTGRRIINDAEVGDHHAIIPTEKTPNMSKLSGRESKIYDLIVRRTIGAFYPNAVFAQTKIATAIASHIFITSGQVRKVAGWQEVDPPPKYKKGKQPDPILPSVTKGDSVPLEDTRLHQGQTQPPKRYSENALLGAMERAGQELDDDEVRRAMKEAGLGTPATRASVIETLLRRDYIARSGKVLVPRPKGRVLIESIPSEDLKSAELTGQWEARLNRIADGKLPRDTFMKEVRQLTTKLTETLLTQPLDIPEEALEREVLGTCPICGGEVFETRKVYTCTGGRECSFVIFKKIARRKTSKGLVKLLLAGKTSRHLKGFYSKRTKKKFSARLKLDEEGKATFVFGDDDKEDNEEKTRSSSSTTSQKPSTDAPHTSPEGLTCPKCEEGDIITGNRGWGCSRWRQGCDFVVWYEQQGTKIDAPTGARLINAGQTDPLPGLGGRRLVLDLDAEGYVRVRS